MPLELTISNEQKVSVSVKPVTDTGKPAKLDGAPVWSTISGDSTLVVSADGLMADLVSSDSLGDTVFEITADADLGEGVIEIKDQITLHVTGAFATNLGLVAGTPQPK